MRTLLVTCLAASALMSSPLAQTLAPSSAAVPFDQVWSRLKAGRTYRAEPTGRIELPSVDHGTRLDNVLEVPPEYVPSRSWPLRVTLHGGVGRPAPRAGDEPARPLANRIPGTPELVLHPRAWAQSEWWTAGQVENILTLLDTVKAKAKREGVSMRTLTLRLWKEWVERP